MSETASVNIPKDLMEPIIREHLHAGVVAALGDPAKLVDKVVELALSQKVDSDGSVSRYQSDNKHDIVEVLAKKAINAAVHDAVAAYIGEQRPLVEKSVKAALQKKSGQFARALVDGLLECAKSNWKINVDVSIPSNR